MAGRLREYQEARVLNRKTRANRYFGSLRDRTYFDSDQQQSIESIGGRNAIPSHVTIGPTFFEGFNNFPGARYHFQVNLARNDSGALEAAVEEARQAVKKIQGNLESLEIGNEVDSYPNRVRPADYTVQDYVSEWLQYSKMITEQVFLDNSYGLDPLGAFQAPVYARPIAKNPGFTL